MERVQNLESLVKELRQQLDQAESARGLAGTGSSAVTHSAHSKDGASVQRNDSSTDTSSMNKQFGRLVIQDASRSYYVSSGFWSEINDEVS